MNNSEFEYLPPFGGGGGGGGGGGDFPFLNVRDFGAVGDAVWNGSTFVGTDDTAAIQDALAAVTADTNAHGNTLVFPKSSGAYLCLGELDLVDSVGVTLLGTGAASDANVIYGWPGAAIVYVGGGSGRFIDARSASGLTIERLGVMYVGSFSGTLIDLSHSDSGADAQQFMAFRSMIAGAGTMTAHALIKWTNAIFCHVDSCHLGQAQHGIRGGEETADSVAYSNNNSVRRSSFIRTVSAITNPGQSWVIEGNGFEGLQGGLSDYMHHAVSFDYTLNATGANLFTFRDNWCGDAFGDQVWIDVNQSSLRVATIEGNLFAGGAAGINLNADGATPVISGGAVSIRGNDFTSLTDYAVDAGDSAERLYNAIEFVGNDVSGVASTTPLLGGAGSFDGHLHVSRNSNRVDPTQSANMTPILDPSTDLATQTELDAEVALRATGDTVVTANTQTTDYTLVLGDAGKVVEMNSGSARALTVPPNASVAFPVGTVIEVARLGSGTVTLTPGSGVTISSRAGLLTVGNQYGSVSLRKRATNTWVAVGDLA